MFILNCVRGDEKRRNCNSALAFMMQEHDIYHLINHIWQGRSAVSKIDDLFLLRMVRYQRDVEWSPWNCILLTEDEADVHSHINDLTTIYSSHLIKQIALAHQIAQNYFKYVNNIFLYVYLYYNVLNNGKLSILTKLLLKCCRQLIIYEKDYRESCRFHTIQNRK